MLHRAPELDKREWNLGFNKRLGISSLHELRTASQGGVSACMYYIYCVYNWVWESRVGSSTESV